MREHDCPFEQDVLDAVRTGRWPHRCDASLSSHVFACPVCSDVAVVAVAMTEAAAGDEDVPPLPLAGAVWWRAQRQARQDAARQAARPVRVAQAVALACTLALVAAFGAAALDWLSRAAGWFGALLPSLSVPTAGFAEGPVAVRVALLLGAVAAFVLAPVAFYVSMTDE